jgi:hypothetical protein
MRVRPTVQWKGDNTGEIEHLLRDHLVRADKAGDKLQVHGIGLNIELSLGDSLIVEGDRLGVLRAATTQPLKEAYVTWKGDNVAEMARFMSDYKVDFMVTGELLSVIGKEVSVVLARGDRLVKRDGQIVVSMAGKQHRYG